MPYEVAPSSLPRLDLAGAVATVDPAAMGFAATRILPLLESPAVSGEFRRHSLETWLQVLKTKRASNSSAKSVNMKLTRDTFDLLEYCLENGVDVTQADVLMADGMDDAERVRLNNTLILRDVEVDAAALLENETTFADNLKTVGTLWSNTSSTPIDDVNDAKSKVVIATGLQPNFLRLCYEQLKYLATNTQVVGRYKGVRTDIVPTFTGADAAKALADVFEVEEVIICNGRKNSADLGQTVSAAGIWTSSYAMVGFKSNGSHRDVQLGRHICLTTEDFDGIETQARGQQDLAGLNLYVDEYGDPKTKSHYLRSTRTLLGKVWEAKCASLLKTVI